MRKSWKNRFGGKFRSSDSDVETFRCPQTPRRRCGGDAWRHRSGAQGRDQGQSNALAGGQGSGPFTARRLYEAPSPRGMGRTEKGRDQRTEPQRTPRLKVREEKRSLESSWVGSAEEGSAYFQGATESKLLWLL